MTSEFCYCLLLCIIFTLAHVSQQNLQNLFSYFITLRILKPIRNLFKAHSKLFETRSKLVRNCSKLVRNPFETRSKLVRNSVETCSKLVRNSFETRIVRPLLHKFLSCYCPISSIFRAFCTTAD